MCQIGCYNEDHWGDCDLKLNYCPIQREGERQDYIDKRVIYLKNKIEYLDKKGISMINTLEQFEYLFITDYFKTTETYEILDDLLWLYGVDCLNTVLSPTSFNTTIEEMVKILQRYDFESRT